MFIDNLLYEMSHFAFIYSHNTSKYNEPKTKTSCYQWNVAHRIQRAKKVVSDSPGLVDFAIGLVNSFLNLPGGQGRYFEEFNLQKNCETNSVHQKFGGLVEMMFGLVNASFSLPEWQAVKMTFFAPWNTPACK